MSQTTPLVGVFSVYCIYMWPTFMYAGVWDAQKGWSDYWKSVQGLWGALCPR